MKKHVFLIGFNLLSFFVVQIVGIAVWGGDSANAQDWKPVVLKAVSMDQESGRIVIVLPSGLSIKIMHDDVSQELSNQIAESQKLKQSDSDNPLATIKVKCAKDWPNDFAMRKYCQDQQEKAVESLKKRDMTSSNDLQTIRTKCAADWPDDFNMRNYCETRQIEALREL